MTGGENFLGRWSRRKQAERDAADGDDAPAADAAPETETTAADAATETETTAADGDDAVIDPADLPDIDSLGKDSDFTVFMQNGVPDALRNRALRKLWTTDPVLANLDGLNDYDEDFGAIMRTGAAFMRRIAAEEARKAAAVANADDTEPDDGGSDVAGDPTRSTPESHSKGADSEGAEQVAESSADAEAFADDDPTEPA